MQWKLVWTSSNRRQSFDDGDDVPETQIEGEGAMEMEQEQFQGDIAADGRGHRRGSGEGEGSAYQDSHSWHRGG